MLVSGHLSCFQIAICALVFFTFFRKTSSYSFQGTVLPYVLLNLERYQLNSLLSIINSSYIWTSRGEVEGTLWSVLLVLPLHSVGSGLSKYVYWPPCHVPVEHVFRSTGIPYCPSTSMKWKRFRIPTSQNDRVEFDGLGLRSMCSYSLLMQLYSIRSIIHGPHHRDNPSLSYPVWRSAGHLEICQ
jgi:hypothetical protein